MSRGENIIRMYNESFQYILKHCGTDQYFNMYRHDLLSSIFISYLRPKTHYENLKQNYARDWSIHI
jgi:hypothetical protein